ncbi:1,6-dihydroxycyclohexa-2,4-diene-1-carboxylate dehydrogenase [Pseudonocardia sp. DSM 110487]|uniref:benzoate 1,2-dioxygenase electron transfer component BenC n=1 Tax=Pseudonocardia sp. DSM 110487 TaxID=2865833 RepID=UPI001C6A2BB3|nr:benzoate 1,2-dioxygenase electron transfer component BenC [Pseudonocardia sp. DSM 110487]QYN33900.1 1,6-dihydroxycyclohexa-2,4-diene-1-carboxylate dehydrogenase [Pseudonocardia sp. DSM 110487]
MSHRVALAFEDGVTRFVTCAEDQTVTDASYRARINIPMDCRDGVCGTCKAFCESGEFDRGSYLEDALAPDEERAGYVLACQLTPRSDLVLQIAGTSAAARTGAATHHGTLTGLDRLSPTTVALTIEIHDREELTFLPGQYVNIAVPGTEESRSYSFSNAPADQALTFLVKLTPGGVMSEYLEHRARVGDEISFTGPHGSFFLRESDAPLLLLAGGTGLAPILSILRTLDAAGSTRPVRLLYGATTDDDVVELATIERLASTIPNLSWDYCVADPSTSAKHQGYVTGLIEPEHLHDGATAVYLCGPPAMVDAVRGHFTDRDIVPSGFFYERFAPAAPLAVSTDEAPTIVTKSPVPLGDTGLLVLAGEGRTVTGQLVLPATELAAVGASAGRSPDGARGICGQAVFPGRSGSGEGTVLTLDDGDDLVAAGARSVTGQEAFPATGLAPITPPPAAEHRPRFVTPGRFDRKVVVVTGAAQGIGRAVGERAAAEGGLIVLVDRSPLVHEVADGLLADGAKALAVVADLEEFAAADEALREARDWQGRIDVLVNNVGGAINFKPYTEFTEAEIAAEIRRSLMPTLWCCRAVLPGMVERGGGVIVNVSSVATRGIHRIPYSAAKGGINALTASLAMEYADAGVRVVASAPGGTDAPPRRIPRGNSVPQNAQEAAWYQAHQDQTIASSLLKRYGTLDEQAAAILFLASDEASYVTGSVLPVGGGDLG